MAGANVKVLLAGDVMLGRGIDQVLPNPGSPELRESYVEDARRYVELAERENGPLPESIDYGYVWGNALSLLESERPDLRIVNLETGVTTSDDFWPSKGIHYRMHPRNVPSLTSAGIDCCVLANNHVMDFGAAGLLETLGTLDEAGIATVGAGRDVEQAWRPARFPIDDEHDVLVFGFADASGGVPESWRARGDEPGVALLKDLSAETAKSVAARILAAKKTGDIVIVSIHWGDNWGYTISRQQREFARHLVDRAQAAIVHGHSSHHPRPIEAYHGSLILYGCGDLINDYEGIGGYERFRPWLSCLYLASMDVTTCQLEQLQIVPMHVRRFRLVEASDEDREWLLHKLNDISAEFLTRFDIAEGDPATMTLSSII